jgi:hypothetical protein
MFTACYLDALQVAAQALEGGVAQRIIRALSLRIYKNIVSNCRTEKVVKSQVCVPWQ